MKNLNFIESLNWWVLLQPQPNPNKFTYEVFKTNHSCFPLLKGILTRGEPISVQQKAVGITRQQIQRLDIELTKLIEEIGS